MADSLCLERPENHLHIQIEVFWVVTPCSVVVGYQRGIYFILHAIILNVFKNLANTELKHS